jgi:fermentation-respiration switch protein FrsA (DUF1100 family)
MAGARYPRIVRLAILAVLFVGAMWLLVRLMQPSMAFFPMRGVQRTPDAFGLQYETLQIDTADGVRLHGWWMPHASPRAQVIYWHGNGGNLALWLDVLADLRQRGFSVLAVDYRGYGDSEGSPSEQGIYADAEAANAYFREHLRRADTPTIYWGRSLGAAVASRAAAQDQPDALILESPFPDVRFLFRRNPIMLPLAYLGSYRFPTAEHLERYQGPLLVIHGDADSIIPFAAGQRVFESAATPRKTFAVLKGADHNDMHARHPEYWPAVERFVDALRQSR